MNPTTTSVTYPPWQKLIRDAQDRTEQFILEQAAKEEEAARLEKVERARELKRALAFFGIEASPIENSYQLDSFRFYLLNIGSSWGGVTFFQDHSGKFQFHLGVSYLLPPLYDEVYRSDDFYFDIPLNSYVKVNWAEKAEESHLSGLAYSLDTITENAQEFIKRYDEMKSRPPANREAQITPPSIAEELENLIRRIVREEAQADPSGY